MAAAAAREGGALQERRVLEQMQDWVCAWQVWGIRTRKSRSLLQGVQGWWEMCCCVQGIKWWVGRPGGR